MYRSMLALLFLFTTGCAAFGPTDAGESAVYVMRHLQKGDGDDPPLSAQGSANALRLVPFFKTDPPSVIFVSPTRRAQETAAALARALRVTPKLYDPRDPAELLEAVGKEKGTVLIVGHSNTVPDIIERLGGERPPALSDGDYGDVWKISGRNRVVTKRSLGGG